MSSLWGVHTPRRGRRPYPAPGRFGSPPRFWIDARAVSNAGSAAFVAAIGYEIEVERVSARNALTPDSSTGNVGFRCAASLGGET